MGWENGWVSWENGWMDGLSESVVRMVVGVVVCVKVQAQKNQW